MSAVSVTFLAPADSSTVRSRPSVDSGHSLIEVLVVLILVGAALGLPCISSARALGRVEARSSALVWEGAAAAAQTRALWGGSAVEVTASSEGLLVGDRGFGSADVAWGSRIGLPGANVTRWQRDGSVVVRFLPGFGSPDAAGSLYFGPQGGGEKVVIRMESGLTRRTRW